MAYPGRYALASLKAGILWMAFSCVSIGMDEEKPLRYISLVFSPSGSINKGWWSRSGNTTSLVSIDGQYRGPVLFICPLKRGELAMSSFSMRCTSALVSQVQHGSCFRACCTPLKENWCQSVSPGCSTVSSKCIVRLSSLTGVPVFMRPALTPHLVIDSVRL